MLIESSAGMALLGAAQSTNPVAVAVKRGDCAVVTKLVNPDVKENDAETAFLAGRMLAEGVCYQKDPVAAAHFFARSADLGDRSAAQELAATVGLGDATEQDYARAGEMCRAAGVDAQSKSSAYSLGYACTIRTVAGQLMRETLPRGSFQPIAGAVAQVVYTPAGDKLQIKDVPHVANAPVALGSNLPRPLFNAKQEVEKAWHKAQASAPKPDTARLDGEAIELSIDLDMTLEAARATGPSVDQPSMKAQFQKDLQLVPMSH